MVSGGMEAPKFEEAFERVMVGVLQLINLFY